MILAEILHQAESRRRGKQQETQDYRLLRHRQSGNRVDIPVRRLFWCELARDPPTTPGGGAAGGGESPPRMRAQPA